MKTMTVLHEIKAMLVAKFGSQISRVILFGSQRAMEIKPESDIDILVVFQGEVDWEIKRTIQDLCYAIDLQYEVLTDVKVISAEAMNGLQGKQPFIQNALSQGMAV